MNNYNKQSVVELGNETFAGIDNKKKNIFGNERVKKTPKKLYHFTLDTNITSICNSRKLKADAWGYVYLTETLEDCVKFILTYANMEKRDIFADYSIIEIDVKSLGTNFNKKHLYVSHDHNPDHFFGANAVMYNDCLKIGATAKVFKLDKELSIKEGYLVGKRVR
jgi:hypothetical protein